MAKRGTATQKPGVLLKALKRELKQGWPPGLTVLSGDDLYHLDVAQKALLETLVPPDATDFALSVFGDERVEVATVIAAARSAAMFAPRRVVLVREVAALDGEPDALTSYAQNPPPDSYLLVRAPQLDLRRKLHKALAGGGRFLDFRVPRYLDDRDLLDEMRRLAGEKGLTLDRAAVGFIVEVTAGDLYAIDAELEKLAAWLADQPKRKVTLEAARQVAAGSQLMSGWEVADAVLLRDRAAALGAAARLVEGGDEPIRIVGGVAWRARVMLQAKARLERGEPEAAVVKATRAWGYKDNLIRGLSRYSLEELLAFPLHLLQADRALKSGAVRPRAVLESLLDRLVG